MRFMFGAAQDIGKRDGQEDAFAAARLDTKGAGKALVCAVCDGMGGHAYGEEAAAAGCRSFIEGFEAAAAEHSAAHSMRCAAFDANEAVWDLAGRLRARDNCGSTLVAAAAGGFGFTWVSVGDSMVLFYSSGEASQLSDEHTVGSELDLGVKAGLISEEYAASAGNRHAITSYLGMEELRRVSHGDIPADAVTPGTAMLLCSDGVTNVLTNKGIATLWDKDPQTWADRIKDAILRVGHPYQDNLTVMIIEKEA